LSPANPTGNHIVLTAVKNICLYLRPRRQAVGVTANVDDHRSEKHDAPSHASAASCGALGHLARRANAVWTRPCCAETSRPTFLATDFVRPA
jgi:hypothetical protein